MHQMNLFVSQFYRYNFRGLTSVEFITILTVKPPNTLTTVPGFSKAFPKNISIQETMFYDNGFIVNYIWDIPHGSKETCLTQLNA